MTTAKESELMSQSHANSKSLFARTGKDRDMAKIREGNRGRGDTHEGLSGEHYGERCLESAGNRGECEDKRGRRLRRRRRRNMTAPLPINPSWHNSYVAFSVSSIHSSFSSSTINHHAMFIRCHQQSIIIRCHQQSFINQSSFNHHHHDACCHNKQSSSVIIMPSSSSCHQSFMNDHHHHHAYMQSIDSMNTIFFMY